MKRRKNSPGTPTRAPALPENALSHCLREFIDCRRLARPLGAHAAAATSSAASLHPLVRRAGTCEPDRDHATDPGALSAPSVPLSQERWSTAHVREPVHGTGALEGLLQMAHSRPLHALQRRCGARAAEGDGEACTSHPLGRRGRIDPRGARHERGRSGYGIGPSWKCSTRLRSAAWS